MLDAVVVVMQVVYIVHVVVVQIGPLQGLAATEVLLAAESVLVRAWLVLLSVDWDLGWGAAKWSDLGRCRGAGLGGSSNHLAADELALGSNVLAIRSNVLALSSNVLGIGSNVLGSNELAIRSNMLAELLLLIVLEGSLKCGILLLTGNKLTSVIQHLVLSDLVLNCSELLGASRLKEDILGGHDVHLLPGAEKWHVNNT